MAHIFTLLRSQQQKWFQSRQCVRLCENFPHKTSGCLHGSARHWKVLQGALQLVGSLFGSDSVDADRETLLIMPMAFVEVADNGERPQTKTRSAIKDLNNV